MKLNTPKLEFLLSKEVLKEEHAFFMGESVQFGVPNDTKLRQKVIDHHRKGQEVLKDFKKWLIKTRGVTPATAKNHAGRVWDALCFTFDETMNRSRPWQVLDDNRYNYSTVQFYRSALKYWATYNEDAELMTELTLRSRSKAKSMVRQAPRASATLYTVREVRRLLRNVDKFKEDPRYPWAWPILRLVLLTGMSPTDAVWIGKQRLQEHSSTLEIWSRTRKTQKIPLELIRDEVDILLAIPWRWEIIADIIAPSSGKTRRLKHARKALLDRMKEVFAAAKIHQDRNWITRLRLTAARRYYKKSKSLVAAGQILGLRDINEVRLRLGA